MLSKTQKDKFVTILSQIEENHNIRILCASGYPDPNLYAGNYYDDGYHINFVYAHQPQKYMKINPPIDKIHRTSAQEHAQFEGLDIKNFLKQAMRSTENLIDDEIITTRHAFMPTASFIEAQDRIIESDADKLFETCLEACWKEEKLEPLMDLDAERPEITLIYPTDDEFDIDKIYHDFKTQNPELALKEVMLCPEQTYSPMRRIKEIRKAIKLLTKKEQLLIITTEPISLRTAEITAAHCAIADNVHKLLASNTDNTTRFIKTESSEDLYEPGAKAFDTLENMIYASENYI